MKTLRIPFGPRPNHCVVATACFLLLSVSLAFSQGGSERSTARVVVLGFDGADPRLVEKWMDDGELPNLDRLRREGSYAPLGTTTPPQTPVSWTSFATGRNPGRHGIFDFLSRDRRTYQPGYAMFDVSERRIGLGRGNKWAAAALGAALFMGLPLWKLRSRLRRTWTAALAIGVLGFGGGYSAGAHYIPIKRPVVTRKTEGVTFWELASKAGKKCRVIRVPAMFPPEPFEHGEIHAGLGVPDIRATSGTYYFYTTEPNLSPSANTEKGGKIESVAFLNGEAETRVFGPRNKLFDPPPSDITLPLHIKLNRHGPPPSVTLRVSGQSIVLREGEWSDWVRLVFPFNRFIKARGIARFHLASFEPFGLYLSPINLDPEAPPFPISEPREFSRDLSRRFGLYKTIGWENDTFALDEKILDEKAFLEDVEFTVAAWLPIMERLLVEGDLDLYVHVWDFTDRVGHMFWRTLDPEHPAADSLADAPYGDAVLTAYKKMDEIVGRVRSLMPENSLLLVCSDHGFNTWHKSVNYNTWLVKNGFMSLKEPSASQQMTLEDLFGQGQSWPNVDWPNTRAYALGLGDLYVNLKRREAQGSVSPEDYDAVRDSLIVKLEAFVDSSTGERPVRRVYRREEVFKGFDPNLIPDLVIANNAKYRVSWQTALGGIPPQIFETNDKKWSGDHCSLDREITKGVLLSNRRLDVREATILDLYPTILEELGLEPPADLDGRPIPSLP